MKTVKYLLLVLCILTSSISHADECTSITSPCIDYKTHVMSLNKVDLLKEVSKNFGLFAYYCTTRWTAAGVRAAWAGPNPSFSAQISETVKPCLEYTGRYTHSTNYYFYDSFLDKQ
jgi:hypothetical protein